MVVFWRRIVEPQHWFFTGKGAGICWALTIRSEEETSSSCSIYVWKIARKKNTTKDRRKTSLTRRRSPLNVKCLNLQKDAISVSDMKQKTATSASLELIQYMVRLLSIEQSIFNQLSPPPFVSCLRLTQLLIIFS